MYGVLYSLARIVAELFREPDVQLGFIYSDWLTMGMLISGIFAIFSLSVLFIVDKKRKTT